MAAIQQELRNLIGSRLIGLGISLSLRITSGTRFCFPDRARKKATHDRRLDRLRFPLVSCWRWLGGRYITKVVDLRYCAIGYPGRL